MKGVADVNSVVGAPITTPDGTTLIPVSKVSLGIAGAGGDFDNEGKKGKRNVPGGTCSGANITLLACIGINYGNTRVLYMNQGSGSAVDKIIDMAPQAFDKITNYIDEKNREKKASEMTE